MSTDKPRYSQHALTSGCIVIMDREACDIVCELRDERDAAKVVERLEHHRGTIRLLALQVHELQVKVHQLTDELARVRAAAEPVA